MKLAIITMLLLGISSATPAPRTIDVVAGSDDVFRLPGSNAGVLRVRAGEKLHFHIDVKAGDGRAIDGAVHSFVIRSLRDQGWDVRLKPGLQDVYLAAPVTAGTYLIECTVMCGPNHDNMHLKLVVE